MDMLGGLTASEFLRDYWQKKPLVIRQAFPGFRCPVSPDELAGLACEEAVESRIVIENDAGKPWQPHNGPPTPVLASSIVTSWSNSIPDRWGLGERMAAMNAPLPPPKSTTLLRCEKSYAFKIAEVSALVIDFISSWKPVFARPCTKFLYQRPGHLQGQPNSSVRFQ